MRNSDSLTEILMTHLTEVLWLITCHLTLSLCRMKQTHSCNIMHQKQLWLCILSVSDGEINDAHNADCGVPDLQHVGKQRAQQGAEQTVIVLLRTREHQLPQKQPYHLLRKVIVNIKKYSCLVTID